MRKVSVTVTTNASGVADVDTDVVSGQLSRIAYVKNNYDAGVDFTITLKSTGENVWVESNVNATASRLPRLPTHDTVGAASLFAAAGEPVEDKMAVHDDRFRIQIAQGGDTKSGTFHFFLV